MTTTTPPTIFQQFEQFCRGPMWFDPLSNHYTLTHNEYGCTIVDTREWHELTLWGATVFFPGVEGRAQAEQYILSLTRHGHGHGHN